MTSPSITEDRADIDLGSESIRCFRLEFVFLRQSNIGGVTESFRDEIPGNRFEPTSRDSVNLTGKSLQSKTLSNCVQLREELHYELEPFLIQIIYTEEVDSL